MNIDQYIINITTLSSTKSSFLISDYLGGSYSLFPQLAIEGAPNITTRNNLKSQNKVQVKWLEEHIVKRSIEPWKNVDTWYLACLLYENNPIALLRNTSNNEDRYSKLIVFNNNQYYYAASYLYNFVQEDPGPDLEIYDMSGSFSGDTAPNINRTNIKSYDLNNPNDKIFINSVLKYTLENY